MLSKWEAIQKSAARERVEQERTETAYARDLIDSSPVHLAPVQVKATDTVTELEIIRAALRRAIGAQQQRENANNSSHSFDPSTLMVEIDTKNNTSERTCATV